MLDVLQLRHYVLEPTLRHIARAEPRLNTPDAQELVIGTLVHESRLTYLHQIGGGPARGLLQMEPPTHAWMRRWLGRRPSWREVFDALLAPHPKPLEQLYTNMAYMVAACRWRFWVAPAPLPPRDNVMAMAHYWDRWYQTVKDEVEPRKWAAAYRRHTLGSRPD